jgi:hypothetical protein
MNFRANITALRPRGRLPLGTLSSGSPWQTTGSRSSIRGKRENRGERDAFRDSNLPCQNYSSAVYRSGFPGEPGSAV